MAVPRATAAIGGTTKYLTFSSKSSAYGIDRPRGKRRFRGSGCSSRTSGVRPAAALEEEYPQMLHVGLGPGIERSCAIPARKSKQNPRRTETQSLAGSHSNSATKAEGRALRWIRPSSCDNSAMTLCKLGQAAKEDPTSSQAKIEPVGRGEGPVGPGDIVKLLRAAERLHGPGNARSRTGGIPWGPPARRPCRTLRSTPADEACSFSPLPTHSTASKLDIMIHISIVLTPPAFGPRPLMELPVLSRDAFACKKGRLP